MSSEVSIEMATMMAYDNHKSCTSIIASEMESDEPLRKITRYWEKDQGPHQVFVDIYIERFDKIDTPNQIFSASFTVTQTWLCSEEDQRKFKHLHQSQYNINNKSTTDIFKKEAEDTEARSTDHVDEWDLSWSPKDLKFPNAEKDTIQITEDHVSLKNYNQIIMIEKKTHVSGVFNEKFELDSFPFDYQDFRIEIAWQDPESECRIFPNPLRAEFLTMKLDSITQREFKIHEPIVEIHLTPSTTMSGMFKPKTIYHPSVQIYLKGERYWGRYFYQIVLMMTLMTTSSLSVFTLDVDDGGGRLTAILTIFLTKVSFLFAISTLLPKISYLTILDKYILACMIFSFSIGIQASAVSFLHGLTEVKFYPWYFKILLLSNASILLLGNLLFALCIKFKVIPRQKENLFKFDWYDNDHDINEVANEDQHLHNFSSERNVMFDMLSNLTIEQKIVPKKFQVLSLFATHLSGRRANYIFYGKETTKALFSCNTFRLNNDMKENAANFDTIYRELGGIWTLPFDRDHELLFSCIVFEHNTSELWLRKLTGDSNVPAGKISLKTKGIPVLESEKFTNAVMQMREDENDPNGFKWMKSKLRFPNKNEMVFEVEESGFKWELGHYDTNIKSEGVSKPEIFTWDDFDM